MFSGLMVLLMGCYAEFPIQNFPPVFTIEEPLTEIETGRVYNVGEPIPLLLRVDDPDNGAQEVVVTIVSNLEGKLFEGNPDASGVVSLLDSSLQRGIHQMTVSVTDGEHLVSQSLLVEINDLPVVSEMVILPENPTTTDDLYVDIISVQDWEEDDVELQVEWLLSGTETAEQNATLPASLTTKGERWSVRVTPIDYNGQGVSVEASVVIGDSPPQVSNLQITPAENVYNDQELNCTADVMDPDGDEVDPVYVWAVYENEWSYINHDTQVFTPVPSIIQPGTRLYCGVFFEQPPGEIDDIVKTFVDIGNRDPLVEELAITAPTGTGLGDTLTCTGLKEDPDSSSLLSSYRWYNDTLGLLLESVSEEETSDLQLTPQLVSKGDVIRCLYSVTDPQGGEGEAETTLTVSNSPPQLLSTGVILHPIAPQVTDDIECTAGSSDVDGDVVTLQYQWTKNGITLSETGNTLVSGSYGEVTAGDQIRCRITPVDSDGLSGSMEHASVVIANSPPEISSVWLTNDPAMVFTDSVIVSGVTASDADGDNISYDYNWYINGALRPIAMNNALIGSEILPNGSPMFVKGDTVYVEITPIDENGTEGTPVTSNSLTILNSPPTAPEISFGDDYTPVGDDLHCAITTPSVDVDGDPVSYTFSITEDGVAPPTGVRSNIYSGDSVVSSSTEISSVWQCSVTVDDGIVTVDPVQAETIISACSFSEVYDVEEAFEDLSDIQDCWSAGVVQELPYFEVLFGIFEDNWEGVDMDVLGYSYLNVYSTVISNRQKLVRNEEVDDITIGDITFESGVLALYPGSGHPNFDTFLRWKAPLDGECDFTVGFMGLSPSNSSVRIRLFEGATQLSSTTLFGYLSEELIDVQHSVSAGDEFTLVVDRSISSAGLDWVSVSGAVACDF